MIKNNWRTIIYSILFIFCTLSTFAQEGVPSEPIGWTPTDPDGTPIDEGDEENADTIPNEPIVAPIDNHIWLLLVSGLSLGVFIVHTQNKKQPTVEYKK